MGKRGGDFEIEIPILPSKEASHSERSYAGDVEPHTAWEVLQKVASSLLLDVRTKEEWIFVGVPDLSPLEKEPLFVPWQSFPDMAPNPNFSDDIQKALRDTPRDAPLFCLCRSGQRSRHAAGALTSLGFERSFNVAQGFEGACDEEGHRGRIGGWKFAKLPWKQS